MSIYPFDQNSPYKAPINATRCTIFDPSVNLKQQIMISPAYHINLWSKTRPTKRLSPWSTSSLTNSKLLSTFTWKLELPFARNYRASRHPLRKFCWLRYSWLTLKIRLKVCCHSPYCFIYWEFYCKDSYNTVWVKLSEVTELLSVWRFVCWAGMSLFRTHVLIFPL